MGGYLAYAEYKDSAIEGLGEIPSHWKIWKATHGFNKIGSGTTPKSDNSLYYEGDVPWITTAELRESVIYRTSQQLTKLALKDNPTLNYYEAGSLAIAMYGATIGRLGILGVDATVNQACCVFSDPTVFDTSFFYYWLWMRRPILVSLSNGGGQPNLNQDTLKQLRIPIPTVLEQQQIAAFLDHKTAQIDALIAKKEALLEKLAEKRTALISQAVTKGLDPNVDMKDSGVEWLGEIPAHWDVVRIKFLIARIESGFSPQCYGFPPNVGEWGVLKTGCVNGGIFNPENSKTLPEDNDLPLKLEISKDDVLMSRASGSVELIGSVAYVEEQPASHLLLSDKIFRINLHAEVCDKRYFVLVMGAPIVRQQIKQVISGAEGLANNISQSSIREIVIPLPSFSIQEDIKRFLSSALPQLDKQMDKTTQAVQTLKEYRTALITNAVTGKIDVRDIKLPQPTPSAAQSLEATKAKA